MKTTTIVRNSFQDIPEMKNTHFSVHTMNSTRKLEVNLAQVVQIKVCHQSGSKLLIYGEQSELQKNAFPFAWCSRVTIRDTRKWRACSQAGLLFALSVIVNLCNGES